MSDMVEKESFFTWVKDHKTELIILSVTVVGTVLVVKNWDSIKGIFRSSDSILTPNVKIIPILDEVVIPVLPFDIMDNLTGNKLTATELGNKALCAAQTINKRIVAAGLATKSPYGGYSLTEAGRLLGELTFKTTRAEYSFSNIEWDEKILEIIFSAEELMEIADKQAIIREILSRVVA